MRSCVFLIRNENSETNFIQVYYSINSCFLPPPPIQSPKGLFSRLLIILDYESARVIFCYFSSRFSPNAANKILCGWPLS